MGAVYANTDDLIIFGRPLTAAELDKVGALLEIASAELRLTAQKYGIDLDGRVNESEDYALTVRQVVCSAVIRALNAASDSGAAAVQATQSALGYSQTYTYQNPGEGLYFLRNEEKRLGFRRQSYGVIEFYGGG